VREQRHGSEVPPPSRQRGEDGGVGLRVGRDAVGRHVVEQQPLGVADKVGLAVSGDGGVVRLEVGPDPRGAQSGEERQGLGRVSTAEGKVDEVGEEDQVRSHGVILHERQEGERVVEVARAGERGEEGGVGERVGGHAPLPHLEEEAGSEAEVASAAGRAEEQVIGDEERGGREVRREEVEQRDAAARVGKAGEERTEEAHGDGPVRGEHGGQVGSRPRGGERGDEGGDVDRTVLVLPLLELGGGLMALVEGVRGGQVGVQPDGFRGGDPAVRRGWERRGRGCSGRHWVSAWPRGSGSGSGSGAAAWKRMRDGYGDFFFF